MSTLLWLVMTGLTTATVSRADVNEAQQLSKAGWQLWQKQEFADAEEKFAKSVKLNPKDADAWNGLGWTQFNGGRSGEAINAFKQCVKLKPKHPAGLNGLGQIYLMWGDLPQAEKYLKKAAPQAPAAWFGLARLYLIQGNFKKAKPWVERLAEDPNNAEAQRMLEAVKNEKLSEDLKIMLQPAGKPDDAELGEETETKTQSSKVSAKQQDVSSLPKDEFVEWREQLTSAGEDSKWFVGANFGKTLAALPGNQAFRILEPCWSEIADSVRPQILKGFTPGMMGNKRMNMSFFDVMHLGMTDPNQTVREYAATYLEMQGLPNFANDPEGYAKWLEMNKNRPAEQIVEMAKNPKQEHDAIDNDDEFQEAWQTFFSHDYTKSEMMFRSVLEKTPENPHAMNGLGWSLLNQKKYDEAKPWLKKSIAIEKNHWGALTGLAVILREEGRLDEAVAIWERIAANSEGPNDATINLAEYYLEQKDFDKAAKSYRKLIEWYPDRDAFKRSLEQAEAGLEKQE